MRTQPKKKPASSFGFNYLRNTIVAVSSQHIGWWLMAHKQIYKTSTSSSSYSDQKKTEAGDSCTRKYKTVDGTSRVFPTRHKRHCQEQYQSRISKSGIRKNSTRTTTSTRVKNLVVYAPRARTHARTTQLGDEANADQTVSWSADIADETRLRGGLEMGDERPAETVH
jgi:hypothetical protein